MRDTLNLKSYIKIFISIGISYLKVARKYLHILNAMKPRNVFASWALMLRIRCQDKMSLSLDEALSHHNCQYLFATGCPLGL